jgi:D-glycero-D-manno-heptose 1,7-bisphosphate phosphatase
MKAVILAGGLGTRLLPITEYIPKALVKVDGLPIIHKQLLQLQENNVDEVIVLTGHLGSQIEKYLKTQRFSFKLKVLWSPNHFTPAERLITFKDEIGNNFILIYCDNFLPDSGKVFALNNSAKYRFILNLREKGNIRIIDENRIEIVTTDRSCAFPYVELGYIAIQDTNFFPTLIRYGDLNTCFKHLAEQQLFDFVEYDGDYYTLSNLSVYLKEIDKSKIIFLDRDGIINKNVGHRRYLKNFEEFHFVEDNLEFMQLLSSIGFSFIVITNQPGIATKQVDEIFLKNLHEMIFMKFLELKINIYAIYVCRHHWEDNCSCRKPKPGMIYRAVEDFKLNQNQLLFIGDEEKDLEAAKAAKINGFVVNEKLGDIGNFGLIRNASKIIQELYGVVLE